MHDSHDESKIQESVNRFIESAVSPDLEVRTTVGSTALETLPIVASSPKDVATVLEFLSSVAVDPELDVRCNVLEYIVHIALMLSDPNKSCETLRSFITSHILPIIVNALLDIDPKVVELGDNSLIALLEHCLVPNGYVQERIWPAIIKKMYDHPLTNSIVRVITLMSKMVPWVGCDTTETLFVPLFIKLCSFPDIIPRKACASIIGDFCTVVSLNTVENKLVPTFLTLCSDSIWVVRKACAQVFTSVSSAASSVTRKERLAPAFACLLSDPLSHVRSAAFQSLGPFITTFAQPSVTNLGYNDQGKLVLRHPDGFEFQLNTNIGLNISETEILSSQSNTGSVDIFDKFPEDLVCIDHDLFTGEGGNCSPILWISDDKQKSEKEEESFCGSQLVCDSNQASNEEIPENVSFIDNESSERNEELKMSFRDALTRISGSKEDEKESYSDALTRLSGSKEDEEEEEEYDEEEEKVTYSDALTRLSGSKEEEKVTYSDALTRLSGACKEDEQASVRDALKRLSGDIEEENVCLSGKDSSGRKEEECFNEVAKDFEQFALQSELKVGDDMLKKGFPNRCTRSERRKRRCKRYCIPSQNPFVLSNLDSDNKFKSESINESIKNDEIPLTSEEEFPRIEAKNKSSTHLPIKSASVEVAEKTTVEEKPPQEDEPKISMNESEETSADDTNFNGFLFWRDPIPDIDIDVEMLISMWNCQRTPVKIASVTLLKPQTPIKSTNALLTRSDEVFIKDSDKSINSEKSQPLFCALKKAKERLSLSKRRFLDGNGNDCDDNRGSSVVPDELISHFVSMSSPRQDKMQNELAHYCACFLPAVALTLGPENWALIKQVCNSLAADQQWRVRRIVASSIHELAVIVGSDVASEDLVPIFSGFIKDLDEVRIGALQHLANFLKLLNPSGRIIFLPRISEFLITDYDWNWRFRAELANQLLQIIRLFSPQDVATHLTPVVFSLLQDKVARVRNIALQLVVEVISVINHEGVLVHSAVAELAGQFAHSSRWSRRQTFAHLCTELVEEKALPMDMFARDMLPHLLDISWDKVPNVRLSVARTLSHHIMALDYFANTSSPHNELIMSALKRLQSDKDADVRYFASLLPRNTSESSVMPTQLPEGSSLDSNKLEDETRDSLR